jgi:hypothetical protein
MEHILSKVKDAFKLDQKSALIDLEVYLTKMSRPSSGSSEVKRP